MVCHQDTGFGKRTCRKEGVRQELGMGRRYFWVTAPSARGVNFCDPKTLAALAPQPSVVQ